MVLLCKDTYSGLQLPSIGSVLILSCSASYEDRKHISGAEEAWFEAHCISFTPKKGQAYLCGEMKVGMQNFVL